MTLAAIVLRSTTYSMALFLALPVVFAGVSVPAQAASMVGKPCKKAGLTRQDGSGGTLVCAKNSKGKLVWTLKKPPTPPPTPSPAETPAVMTGNACTTEKALAPTQSIGIAVCKAGKWVYAFNGDVPVVAGYTSRPTWYPTVDQVFGQPGSTCSPDSVAFSSAIIPADQLTASIPYGAMIGSHVTPIDHGYLSPKTLELTDMVRETSPFIAVRTPAAGTITEISDLNSDGPAPVHRVTISHGCGVYSVFMVLDRLESGVVRGTKLAAGQQFGSQRDHMLDYNVFSGGTWLTSLVNPLSYAYGEAWKPYTTDPSAFFKDPLRAGYEGVMQRTSAPRWGKIDYDVRGTAVGAWFLKGTAGYSGLPIDSIDPTAPLYSGTPIPGKNNYAYGHLALAPHWVDTSVWVASMGWFSDSRGDADVHGKGQFVISLAGGLTAPDKLTRAVGTVVYALHSITVLNPDGSRYTLPEGTRSPSPIGYKVAEGSKVGSMAVRVNADESLTVQVLADPSAAFPGFTSDARTYVR